MISAANLYKIARCRYDEAKILLANSQADGAVYLSGYALELILKRRIVSFLDWADGYPETKKEFENLQSFKTHNLDTLLVLSGLSNKMKRDSQVYARWQIASSWTSENRYRQIGMISNEEAANILEATKETINFILHQ